MYLVISSAHPSLSMNSLDKARQTLDLEFIEHTFRLKEAKEEFLKSMIMFI